MRDIDKLVTGPRAYIGEMRFVFYGDEYAAQGLTALARVVMGNAIARSASSPLLVSTGIFTATEQFPPSRRMPRGAEIRVMGVKGQYTAMIKVPGNSPRVPPRVEGVAAIEQPAIPEPRPAPGTIAVGACLIGSSYRPAIWINGQPVDVELLSPLANGEMRAVAKDGSRAVGSRLTTVGGESTFDRESFVWTPGSLATVTGTDPKEYMAGVSNAGDMVSGHTHAEYLAILGAFVRRSEDFSITYQYPVGIFGGNFIETTDIAISPNGKYMASVFSVSADPGLSGGGPRFDTLPYVWVEGVGPTLLANTGSAYSAIGGVSDAGVVVGAVLGTSISALWGGEAVAWDAASGDRRSLGKGVAMGVGDSAIVGYWGIGPSLTAVCRPWYLGSDGQIELPGDNARATCVTRDGSAIGGYTSSSTFGFEAPFTPVIWRNGSMIALELPPGATGGMVYDIASRG